MDKKIWTLGVDVMEEFIYSINAILKKLRVSQNRIYELKEM